MALTTEGEIFLLEVKTSLRILNNASEKLNRLHHQPSGKLRINAANPFILHVLTPLITPFLQRYPDITIELSSDDNIVDLLEHKSDIAIRIGPLEDSTLKARLLGRSPLFLVASPQYIAKFNAPKQPSDLAQHRFLGFQSPTNLNILPFRHCPTLTPYLTASSGETLRQLSLKTQLRT